MHVYFGSDRLAYVYVCNMFYRFTIGIWGTSVLCWSVLFIVHRQGFHWSQSWPVSQSQNCYRSQNPDRDIWDHFTFTSFWPVLTVILSDRYSKSDRSVRPWKPCPSHSSTNCHSLYLVWLAQYDQPCNRIIGCLLHTAWNGVESTVTHSMFYNGHLKFQNSVFLSIPLYGSHNLAYIACKMDYVCPL